MNLQEMKLKRIKEDPNYIEQCSDKASMASNNSSSEDDKTANDVQMTFFKARKEKSVIQNAPYYLKQRNSQKVKQYELVLSVASVIEEINLEDLK